MRTECQTLLVQIEVHAGVVDQRSLVEVDPQTVVRVHLQRGLHTRRREYGLREVVLHGAFEQRPYFRQARARVVVLLRVVVARYPPCRVVARHRELRKLVHYDEVYEVTLLGKLVAESEAVVEEAETHHHVAVVLRLMKPYRHLVIAVAYLRLLAPYGLPRLVERRSLDARHFEAVVERSLGVDRVRAAGKIRAELVACAAFEFESQTARSDDRLLFVGQHVVRCTLAVERECHRQIAVGRVQLLRLHACRQEQADDR